MPTTLSTYRVTGTAGNVGLPGATILHFDLIIHEATGKGSGVANITLDSPPPIVIPNVTVTVKKVLDVDRPKLIITLSGSYDMIIVNPPLIIVEQFSASFVTNLSWDGRGSFTFGGTSVDDVPVQSTISSVIVPLYAVVMHGAKASGDQQRMKEVAAAADKYLAQVPDVQKALTDLKAAIGGA